MNDPDRFLNLPHPGSQEWWYFDAISDDGRDVLVIVWYAALPFDPDYGVAALRHLRDPSRHPAPDSLDHCAVGVSWYRDGKTVAYALNGFRRHDFHHQADPFRVEIDGNLLLRDDEGYSLTVETPSVDGRRSITARLRFRPAPETVPWERDLGGEGSPHLWALAVPDARVDGDVRIGDLSTSFSGRGYHDHNAGSEELSLAMRRWHWGRAHHGCLTEIYYHAEPRRGSTRGVWITCRDGRPIHIRDISIRTHRSWYNLFGLRTDRALFVGDLARQDEGFSRWHRQCVDDGPFYQRWLSDFSGFERERDVSVRGISELLDTRNLNRRVFNWMIPFRLKKRGTRKKVSAVSRNDP